MWVVRRTEVGRLPGLELIEAGGTPRINRR